MTMTTRQQNCAHEWVAYVRWIHMAVGHVDAKKVPVVAWATPRNGRRDHDPIGDDVFCARCRLLYVYSPAARQNL